MSIYNNSDLNYNYDGNGVTLSSFNEPTSIISNVIGSSIVPQENVKDLKKDLSALSVGIEESCKEFQSFKKHIEHDIEEKEFEFDIHKNVTEQVIKNNKLDLDVFKSAQKNFNDDQIGINLAHFALIKEIHKTLIIGFSVLVVFMLVTWGYLTYTFFNH